MNGSSYQSRADASAELTLNDLLAMAHRQRWVMASIVFCVLLVGAVVVAHLRPQFDSRSLLYVDPSVDQAGLLTQAMPGLSSSGGLESERWLLRSEAIAREVVHELGLNVEIQGDPAQLRPEPWMWQWRLERDVRRFDHGLRVHDLEVAGLLEPLVVEVAFEANGRLTVHDREGREVAGRLGERVSIGDISFVVSYRGGLPEPGSRFTVRVRPDEESIRELQRRLSISIPDGNTRYSDASLLEVRYRSASPYESQAVVAAVMDRYVEMKHEWATATSRSMLEFVEGQLLELERDLEESTKQLAEFQRESGLLDLEPQLEVDLQRQVEVEIALREGQERRRQLERLASQLELEDPDARVFAHVDDPVIRAQGEELAQINQQLTAMESRFRDTYQPLRELRQQREQVQQRLRGTVNAYLSRAEETVQELREQVAEDEARLAELPESARALGEFRRATRLYEQWYMYLLEQQQQASGAEASTLSNIRVVDRSQLPLEEAAPTLRVLAVGTLGLGIFLAGFVGIVREMRITWFRSAEEAREQFAGPVFAIVPALGRRIRRGSARTLESRRQGPFQESIRHLRTNLLHSAGGKSGQTVLITSSMPGAGKTTIASNLGKVMAQSERISSVVLVDADLHRPSLHMVFGCEQSPGLSDYLNGQAELEEIIHAVEVEGGRRMDLIASGPVPPSPVELIETERMRELVRHLAEKYAFTLLDSPPFPAVTTALVLAEQVDRLLTVCRIGHTGRQLFQHHIAELTAVQRHAGMVINLGHHESGDVYGYYHYGDGASSGSNGNGNGRADGRGTEQAGDSESDRVTASPR